MSMPSPLHRKRSASRWARPGICTNQFERSGVIVRSSNYTLYGDMSARVMQVLSTFTPDLEIRTRQMPFETPITIRQAVQNVLDGPYVLPSIQREFILERHPELLDRYLPVAADCRGRAPGPPRQEARGKAGNVLSLKGSMMVGQHDF